MLVDSFVVELGRGHGIDDYGHVVVMVKLQPGVVTVRAAEAQRKQQRQDWYKFEETVRHWDLSVLPVWAANWIFSGRSIS